MAQDTLDFAISRDLLPETKCVTKELKLHGAEGISDSNSLSGYGSDAARVRDLMVSDVYRLRPEIYY